MAKEELEDEIEYEEYDDYLEDKIEKDKSGQVKFQSVDHSKRAEAFGVESDGEISTYANYALEYFRHRCALSGERLVVFDTPVKRGENKKVTTNLSAEHIVALSSGGNDIIPNIVPSVLQYNLQKNGYYILDWWPKAKDINGNSIYSPEKLLKIVNYMLKSLQIRKDLGIKEKPREYRKRLLTPNVIDKYLAKEEVAQKLLSDVITATEEDIDGKKILTKIPVQEGSIPSLAEQKENELKITEEMFLIDAIDVLEREKDIPQEIIEDLKDLYKEVEGEIPFEIQVRKNILSALEEMGIEENKYTVANTLLININLLEQTRENKEEIKKIIKDYLEKQVEGLKEILTEDQIKMAISNMPNALYEETAINRIIFWKETRGQNLEEILQMRINATENLIDVLIILKQHGIDIRKIPNANKQLEEWLRENKIDNKEIEEIMEEITTKGIINLNIGNMQSNQKKKNNIENYKSLLEEAVDEKGEKVFSEEEIEILTISRQISNNQTKDLVDMLIILKQHGIDIRKIPKDNKQLEEWLRENKIDNKEIEEIIEEITTKGIINLNIGNMQSHQKNKNKNNIGDYKSLLEEAVDEKGEKVFSEEEIEILTTSRQKSNNQTKDLVDMLIILKQYGIDIRKIPNQNKQLEEWLREKIKLEENEINKIVEEIQSKGIMNLNIGGMQCNQKNKKNIENYKSLLEEAVDEKGEKVFSKEEIEILTISKQKNNNPTKVLVDILIILKQHGIDIRKIPRANKQLEEWLRENKIDNKEIEEIIEEITRKGIINLNIGNMQSNQKNKKNIENYKSLLEEAVDEKGEKVFTKEEIEILTISKQKSNNQTKDLVDMLIILKQHGIDIRKIPNANKQLEEWLIEKIKLEENEIKEIIKEVESKGIINRNIGKLQNSQKGKDNIKKYKTQLETATYPNGERIFDNLTIKILTGEIDRKKVKDIIKQNKDNLFEAMDIGEELETEIELAERMDERNTNDGR